MDAIQQPLLLVLLVLSILGFVLGLFGHWQKGMAKWLGRLPFLEVLGAGVLLVIRGLLAHGLPFASGVDFAVWLIFVFGIFHLFMVRRGRLYMASGLLHAMGIALIVWMLSVGLEVKPLMPALRSPWLAVHVMAAMLSYSFFAVSFVMAVLLLRDHEDKAHQLLLDDWSYRLILFGLPLLTVMLVTGSIWAEYAWGSYWSWDWKETWALVTWLVYALYLHLRVTGWRQRKAAVLNMIGFGIVIFTFFGVSYLLPGLHSYL